MNVNVSVSVGVGMCISKCEVSASGYACGSWQPTQQGKDSRVQPRVCAHRPHPTCILLPTTWKAQKSTREPRGSQGIKKAGGRTGGSQGDEGRRGEAQERGGPFKMTKS